MSAQCTKPTINASALLKQDYLEKRKPLFSDNSRNFYFKMVKFQGKFFIKVYYAHNLPGEKPEKHDPYCALHINDSEKDKYRKMFATPNKKNTGNPEWNYEKEFTVNGYYNKFRFQVYDKDTFGSDDLIGEAFVEDSLIKAKEGQTHYVFEKEIDLYKEKAKGGTLKVKIEYNEDFTVEQESSSFTDQ